MRGHCSIFYAEADFDWGEFHYPQIKVQNMLTTKLVLRILDVDEQLIGWAEAQAEARGDGKLWVKESVVIPVERDAVTRYMSVHWCDVNVEIRSVVEPKAVKLGEMFSTPEEWEAITVGPAAGGLPSVTVRSPVSIGIPVGVLGAKGNR